MALSSLEACSVLEPFGLSFRQRVPTQPQMAQTTSEPEITTGDGNDPDQIDAEWYPDEDEETDPDEDDD